MTKQVELKKQAYESDLKSRALSILIYLIDRSNKDLTCFPAIPTMAEQLHISVSTVKRALHELVQAGFIKKDTRFREKNRGQTSNLYTLVLREQISEPVEEKKPEANSEKENTAVCAVEHISFDTLKQEQAEDISTDILVREVVETDVVCEEPQAECESAVQNQRMAPTPVQTRTPVRLSYSLCKNKARKLVHGPFQRRALPVLFQWTGVGFNLQPP